MSINIVILAAGQGKRMHSNLPKVLHKLAGVPLLTHVLNTARELNPEKLVVVCGHGASEVKQSILAKDVIFAYQAEQKGTAHAVQQAVDLLSLAPTTLILYGDVPLTRPESLVPLLNQPGLQILTAQLSDPTGYGRIVRENNQIQSIVEEKDASLTQRKITEVNTGIMAIPTKHLARWLTRIQPQNQQGEYYLTDIVGMALADGVAVNSVNVADHWETLGVNTKAQLAQLERYFQVTKANELLEKGVTLADPHRFDVRGQLKCGKEVTIDVGCIFEGEVELCDGVVIGPYCVLKDCVIGENTKIEAFSSLDGARVGTHCKVGPYTRLRPGANLMDQVQIGNFVEIKASHIGQGSKANHLSYIGDSEVGERVNIGAGTITCNYDGANKHKTILEDDVFIGSDTQLVAPVTVRKGATIAAGSTITKEVSANSLAISRVTQKTIAGWTRPKKKRND
jgi:bifunctional UDP-N-acetylglucosamine pyrophosphorylase/glucosamine-1-phosphate N-acetyltransferase